MFLKSKKLKFTIDFNFLGVEDKYPLNWGLEIINFKIYFYSWGYDEHSNTVKYLQEFCNKYNYYYDKF